MLCNSTFNISCLFPRPSVLGQQSRLPRDQRKYPEIVFERYGLLRLANSTDREAKGYSLWLASEGASTRDYMGPIACSGRATGEHILFTSTAWQIPQGLPNKPQRGHVLSNGTAQQNPAGKCTRQQHRQAKFLKDAYLTTAPPSWVSGAEEMNCSAAG